jgi:hypothetical protein
VAASGKRAGRELRAAAHLLKRIGAFARRDTDMQDTDSKDVDWNSEEGKQATERLNRFLEHIDKTAPEGCVRTAVPLGKDEDGEAFGIITWRKP